MGTFDLVLNNEEMPGYIRYALVAAIVAYPALGLLFRAASNVSFYLVFWIGVWLIVSRRNGAGKSFVQFLGKFRFLHLAFVSLFLVTLGSQLFLGLNHPHALRSPFSLAAFVILFWSLLSLSSRDLSRVQWGLAAGALFYAVYYYAFYIYGTDARIGKIREMNLIPFADSVLLTGVLAFMTIRWHEGKRPFFVLLKTLALCAGLLVAIMSLTRGSWLAIPFMLCLAGFCFFRIRAKIFLLMFGISILSVVLVLSNSQLQQRIHVAKEDIVSYTTGSNLDTSLGIRLQLWRSALDIFREQPLFGTGGREEYKEKLEQYAAEGRITPSVPSHSHSHNDILYFTAMHGIFGLLSLLAIYFAPVLYAAKFLGSNDDRLRTASLMVITTAGSFFIFGLTMTMFFTKEQGIFYAIIMATLFALLVKRKMELDEEKHSCISGMPDKTC